MFESMHKPLKQFYLWRTNFKNIAPQILQQEHIGTIMDYIGAEVEAYDEHMKKSNAAAAQNSDAGHEGGNARAPKYDFGNIILQAPPMRSVLPSSKHNTPNQHTHNLKPRPYEVKCE
ncbi:hypothetical protein EST38_g12055 [Candolleomyces aberdarensis]|uniref:Uncharacterized protein n=1 Tax=Candolleomyces aberdarensis TaxID=2316362 RepID=A0A4Q2D419_9AGAR|nr:hypothetical protein EST38_g12055 [Candolleomyces aberdarensis]